MASITKVHGFTVPGQFYGRELVQLNCAGLTAAPAGAGVTAAWPDLDTLIEKLETVCTVSVVGTFVATATSLHLIVEGLDYSSATLATDLSTLTGFTVTIVAI